MWFCVRFNVDLRKELVPARTLGPKGVDYEIPRRLEGERNILYKGVETSP